MGLGRGPRADRGPRAGDATAIRARALTLLAAREHARGELAVKLGARGFEREAIEPVLDRLEHEGLLSDERFVEAFLLSRRERGFGPRRIERELRERGVRAALAAARVEARDPEWQALAEAARRRRFGEALPEAERERARQARFLERRGFTEAHIRALLWRR